MDRKLSEFVGANTPRTIREVGNEAGENLDPLKERIARASEAVRDIRNGGTLEQQLERLEEKIARLREPAEHKLAEDTRTTEQFAGAISDAGDPQSSKQFARSIAG